MRKEWIYGRTCVQSVAGRYREHLWEEVMSDTGTIGEDARKRRRRRRRREVEKM